LSIISKAKVDTDNVLRPTITYDHKAAFRLIDEQLLKLL